MLRAPGVPSDAREKGLGEDAQVTGAGTCGGPSLSGIPKIKESQTPVRVPAPRPRGVLRRALREPRALRVEPHPRGDIQGVLGARGARGGGGPGLRRGRGQRWVLSRPGRPGGAGAGRTRGSCGHGATASVQLNWRRSTCQEEDCGRQSASGRPRRRASAGDRAGWPARVGVRAEGRREPREPCRGRARARPRDAGTEEDARLATAVRVVGVTGERRVESSPRPPSPPSRRCQAPESVKGSHRTPRAAQVPPRGSATFASARGRLSRCPSSTALSFQIKPSAP